METIKNRDILLDTLKGLGILLVVFAHTYLGGIRSIIYLFHVPFFFFLSGAALNYSKVGGNLLKSRIRSLLFPYLVFSLISFIYWACVESHFRAAPTMPIYEGLLGTLDFRIQQFLNIFTAVASLDAMFYNIALWFLPCLFVTLIFYSLLEKWMKQYVGLVILLCPVVYFVLTEMIPYLPFAFEISLVAIVFVYIGKISYIRLKKIRSGGGVLLIIALLIALLFTLKNGIPCYEMRMHQFGNPIAYFFHGLILIAITTLTANVILRKVNGKGLLVWLGKNSLTILCIHEPIKRICIKIVSVLSGIDAEALRYSLLHSAFAFLLTMAVVVLIVMMINKKASWMVGKTSIIRVKEN